MRNSAEKWRVGLFLAMVLLAGVALTAQNTSGLSAALAAGNLDKAESEIKELMKTDAGREAAHGVMQFRLERTVSAFSVAVRNAEAPLSKLKDVAQVEGYLGGIEKWREKASETMAFIMSSKTYPPPSRMPFAPGDLQINQAIVEARVEGAIALWNDRELELAALLGLRTRGTRSPGGGRYAARLERGKLSDPCEEIVPMQRYKFVDMSRGLPRGVAQWRSVFDKYQSLRDALLGEARLAKRLDLAPGELPKIDPLVLSVYYLFNDQVAEALEKAVEIDESRKPLFPIVCHRYLLFKSMTPEGDWRKNEIDALVLVNLYRLSLGLKPMLGNRHIQVAAVEHSQYQARAGMSHTQNNPERATVSKRLAVAGYQDGGASENCASTSDPVAAVWMWRMDSGHHQNLLRGARAAGIAGRGPATYNTGASTGDPLLDRL